MPSGCRCHHHPEREDHVFDGRVLGRRETLLGFSNFCRLCGEHRDEAWHVKGEPDEDGTAVYHDKGVSDDTEID